MEYKLTRSKRKTLGLYIKDGAVEVRAPKRLSLAVIEAFVAEKRGWIEEKLAEYRAQQKIAAELPPLDDGAVRELKKQAQTYLPQRVAFIARAMGVEYGRISIRCQRSRWGSCSSKGNLNFNCLLMLAPPAVRDSVIVHELCHIKEPNHSPRFYALVLSVMQDYYLHHAWLKENGKALLMRLDTK